MRLTLIWTISLIFTLIIVIYQKISGPTYPQKITFENIDLKLPRSCNIGSECKVTIPENDKFDQAYLLWKYYPGAYNYDTLQFSLTEKGWETILPTQPPAGKLQYYLVLSKNNKNIFKTNNKPAIIRFKDKVPTWILIPHIILMFAASFLSIVTLFMIVLKKGAYHLIAYMTLLCLTLGGLFFGPIVQKYAFGQYWTGFPYGFDLTDNKTLVAFIIWLAAILLNIKKNRKWLLITATLATIVINSIPHSTRGSELNRESGKIETSK